MNTAPARNYPLLFVRSVTWVLMIMAAFISASHIVHVSQTLGLQGWYAYTTPLFIDIIAIAGKLSMLSRFDPYPEFQKSGRYMLIAGGTLSLAANIGAGTNWGERGYGVLIVGGFLLLENHLTKAAGKVTATTKPDPDAEAKREARRERARVRRAEQRAANEEAKAKAEAKKIERREREAQRRQQEIDALDAAFYSPAAKPTTGLVIATTTRQVRELANA